MRRPRIRRSRGAGPRRLLGRREDTHGHGRTAPESESLEGPFLSVARRYSLCDDDAWEALARGFEIAMRHRERIRPDTATAWFATVVRHEALRIRRIRCRDVHLDPVRHEPPAEEPGSEREPDPRLPALRAAMRELRPDQRRALMLFYAMDASRGDGGRYGRIMRATGWSFTKVNRCLSEGRAALRAMLLHDAPSGAGTTLDAAPPRSAAHHPAGASR